MPRHPFVGPDVYHLGPPPETLDEGPWDEDCMKDDPTRRGNWWHGMPFPAWYLGGRNLGLRTESGVIVTQNEKPYRDIFALVGDEQLSLSGTFVYSLASDLTSGRFQGLLDRDLRFYFDVEQLGTAVVGNYFRQFYLASSFRALRRAGWAVATRQGTEDLRYFVAEDHPTIDPVTGELGYDASQDLLVGGTVVQIEDGQTWRDGPPPGYVPEGLLGGTSCSSVPVCPEQEQMHDDPCDPYDHHPGRARGIVVRTGPRDYTLAGVDFAATILEDTTSWGGLVVERGGWVGPRWLPMAAPLPGSYFVDAATGALTVALTADALPPLDVQAEAISLRPDRPAHLSFLQQWLAEQEPSTQHILRVYDPTVTSSP